jgi:structural maintenance of chromosome 3 (chondroitin sulfate proteoglycan 6)
MSVSKRETYMQKIQELGSLPPPAELEKFSGKSISDLMKSLEGINKKLKKYSHVNKKAYDQYVNFSEQRESLIKRKEELDQGAAKVKELVESLDRQKDEAINRTFRGVSAHFKDVFKELVPNGSGELIMRTALADEMDDTDGEDESVHSDDSDALPKKKKKFDPNNPDVNFYRGVGIKVQFSSTGENYMMSQLSGGQKALVAMALIFAIQRCDPAPFYLFDELDQALDPTYRAAVANLIQRQANSKDNPTQFIVSTFRPELVAVANSCYGISHQNKVSNLHTLSKRDALKFIANLMNEEEAVGEVTSLATSKTTRLTIESRKRKSTERSIEESDDEESEDALSTQEPIASEASP